MQRNAMGYRPYLSFAALTFSVVVSLGSGVVSAQTTQTTEEGNAEEVASEAQSAQAAALPSNLLVAQPVAVAPAMNSPVPAPMNVSSSSNAVANVGNLSSSLEEGETAVPSTSIEGLGLSESSAVDSSANQNGSGIQIFNLNNNKSDLEAENKNEATTGTRADLLRRERIRQELMNESRLIEKIEEDRIETEGSRSNSIEGLKFTPSGTSAPSNSETLEEVPVAAVSAVPYAPVNSVAAVSTSSSPSSFSSTQFKIAPMGGYRWTQDNNSQFRSENKGIAGVAVEGRIANIFGLEVNYVYGRDSLEQRGYQALGYNNYNYNYYNGGQYGFIYNIRTRDTHEFNANAKLGWFVGSVRPYVMGGFGALYTGYNIDDSATKAQAASIGWKRSSTHLVGNSGVGVDFAVAQNLSVGTRVEYQYIFGTKSTSNPWDIINIYGDTKNKVKALGSVQLIF